MNAEEFRAKLKAHDVTQREFARLIGRETSTVNRWALDKTPIPAEVDFILFLMAQTDAWRPPADDVDAIADDAVDAPIGGDVAGEDSPQT